MWYSSTSQLAGVLINCIYFSTVKFKRKQKLTAEKFHRISNMSETMLIGIFTTNQYELSQPVYLQTHCQAQ